MLHQTIEKLHALKLAAMADGLLAQTRQPDIDALGFEERLALLVDLQHTAAQNAALGQRLKASRLRQTACLEDLDLRTPRGLDRALIQTLASGCARRVRCWFWGQREWARPSWPVRLATKRHGKDSRSCTAGCRTCSMISPSPE